MVYVCARKGKSNLTQLQHSVWHSREACDDETVVCVCLPDVMSDSFSRAAYNGNVATVFDYGAEDITNVTLN